jgi:membrane protein implicated in regulation of membrane protease activity
VDWFGSDAWLLWVGLAALLVAVELLSGDLIFLALGLAAFAASGAGALTESLWVEVAVFGGTALALLSLVRPRLLRRLYQSPDLPMGSLGLVGEIAVVTQSVSHGAGQVNLVGDIWRARPEDSCAEYPVGTEVVVVAIENATAVVAAKE